MLCEARPPRPGQAQGPLIPLSLQKTTPGPSLPILVVNIHQETGAASVLARKEGAFPHSFVKVHQEVAAVRSLSGYLIAPASSSIRNVRCNS